MGAPERSHVGKSVSGSRVAWLNAWNKSAERPGEEENGPPRMGSRALSVARQRRAHLQRDASVRREQHDCVIEWENGLNKPMIKPQNGLESRKNIVAIGMPRGKLAADARGLRMPPSSNACSASRTCLREGAGGPWRNAVHWNTSQAMG